MAPFVPSLSARRFRATTILLYPVPHQQTPGRAFATRTRVPRRQRACGTRRFPNLFAGSPWARNGPGGRRSHGRTEIPSANAFRAARKPEIGQIPLYRFRSARYSVSSFASSISVSTIPLSVATLRARPRRRRFCFRSSSRAFRLSGNVKLTFSRGSSMRPILAQSGQPKVAEPYF
jgi:hypothetical protein